MKSDIVITHRRLGRTMAMEEVDGPVPLPPKPITQSLLEVVQDQDKRIKSLTLSLNCANERLDVIHLLVMASSDSQLIRKYLNIDYPDEDD